MRYPVSIVLAGFFVLFFDKKLPFVSVFSFLLKI